MNICSRTDSVLVVIDLQDSFLAPIKDKEFALKRCKFLIEVATTLQMPIIATEQYASRMGPTNETISKALGKNVARIDKLCFSCSGSEAFVSAITKLNRKQVVLIGIETHICVCQTALDLVRSGLDVWIAADAVAARLPDAHAIALNRMSAAGCTITHTESVCYEWLMSADSSEFKTVLELVKQFAD